MLRPTLLLLLLPLLACDPPPVDTTLPTGRPEGEFSKLERVELARELWGLHEAPRIEGPTALAWDEDTNTLYATRGGSGRVISVQGAERALYDLEAKPAEDAVLLLDGGRRRLVWVGFPGESVRWLDLATGEVVARRDPAEGAPATREALYSHRHAALDPATGWVWVADPGAERVMGYSPEGDSLRVPALRKPVALAFGADGRLWVLDALSRDEVRLAAFSPGTMEVDEVLRTRVPHWYEGPPAFLLPHADGRMSVIGHQGATLDRGYWPEWWEALPSPAWPLGAVETGGLIAVLHLQGGADGQPVLSVVEAATGELLRTLPQPAGSDTIIAAGPREAVVAGDTGSPHLAKLGGSDGHGLFPFAWTADKVIARDGEVMVLDRIGGSLSDQGPDGWRQMGGGAFLDLAGSSRPRVALVGGEEPVVKVVGGMAPSLALGAGPAVQAGSLSLTGDGSLGAVALPARSEVLLVDMGLSSLPWTIRWRISLAGLEPGAEVAFDEARGRVLVGWPEGRLWALDVESGEVVAEVDLPKLLGAPDGYPEGNLFVDEAGGRVFVGPQALDAVTLEPGAVLPAAQRVLWSDDDTVLGLQLQGRGAEWLVQSDAATLATEESWPVGVHSGRPGVSFYDAAAGVLWVPDPLRARLTAWPYPP